MYTAILFAPDGDWVRDYEAGTVGEVQEMVSNGGSRWFFYPFVAIVKATSPDGRGFTFRPKAKVYSGSGLDTWAPVEMGYSGRYPTLGEYRQYIIDNADELLAYS